MKKKYFSVFFTFVVLIGQAQNPSLDFKIPQVLQAAPDVQAFVTGGSLSSSLHTGAAAASIPIYSLNNHGFTLPISLNYNSTGFKPNEHSSRTGVGWALSAGGMVSRTTRGKPDDFISPYPPGGLADFQTVSQISNPSQAGYNFVNYMANPTTDFDAEPDIYQYNVNGISGKFIIMRTGEVLQIPYNNVKINVSKDAYGKVLDIFIKDGDGNLYSFGEGELEQTLEYNYDEVFLNRANITTAWMLKKISLPTGEKFDFSYLTVPHILLTGKTQIYTVANGWDQCIAGSGASCDQNPSYSEKISSVRYSTKCLSNISSSTGSSVNFAYEARSDNSQNNRLKQITVYNENARIIKSFELNFKQGNVIDHLNTNFFLKELISKNPNNAQDVQKFKFSYVNETLTANVVEVGTGQDHLGYANGTSSTASLLPVRNGWESSFNGGYWVTGDRDPKGSEAVKGMLEKITYPTGGYDKFCYEPNSYKSCESIPNVKIKNIRIKVFGTGSNYPLHTRTFLCQKTQIAELYLKSTWTGGGVIPGGDPAPKTAFLRLYDMTDGGIAVTVYRTEGFEGGSGYLLIKPTTPIQIFANHTYKLELEARYGSENQVQGDLVYDDGVGSSPVVIPVELCGVRVKQIEKFDNISRTSTSKYIQYRALEDNCIQSAVQRYGVGYVSNTLTVIPCNATNIEINCPRRVLSSTNAGLSFLGDVPAVAYTYVLESDDKNFINGVTQHMFKHEYGRNDMAIYGQGIPSPPNDPNNFDDGQELETKFFDANLNLVKKVTYSYSKDSRIDKVQHDNYRVRKNFTTLSINTNAWSNESFREFDLSYYSINSSWSHLNQKTTIDYKDNAEFQQVENFTYSSVDNVQPTSMSTLSSDNSILKIDYKYPNDILNVASNVLLKDANRLNSPVKELSFKGAAKIYETNYQYSVFNNTSNNLFLSSVTKQKGTSAIITPVVYDKYDAFGNPLLIVGEGNQTTNYLWDHKGTLPVAEVSNLDNAKKFAYSSFQGNNKGNWEYNENAISNTASITSSRSYNLAAGSLGISSFSTSSTHNVVSFWANGIVLVNGSPCEVKLQKNGWSLYHKEIQGSLSSLSFTGTCLVDEVRFFPFKSFMKTFNYIPEVGIASAMDENNVFSSYEYDGFGRLLLVRDLNKSIVKQYNYELGASFVGCTNTAPDWQPTGNTRCEVRSEFSNEPNGYQQREVNDNNKCSESYGQTVWQRTSNTSACTAVLCPGIGKRYINGVCVQGCKVFESERYLGNLLWEIKFHYYFSQDGYNGPSGFIVSDAPYEPEFCGPILID